MATAYEYIERNKRRSLILLALFPVSSVLFAYAAVLGFYILWGLLKYAHYTNVFSFASVWNQSFISAHEMCVWLLPFCFAVSCFWAWMAYRQGDRIVLDSVAGVRSVSRWDEFDAYTALENICLTVGMPMPQLYVLEDDSLNAFAVGMHPAQAGIVVSRGLLKRLDRVQLEAVFAHELAHIRHYDTRLMAIVITCTAFFAFAGEMLIYGTDRENADHSWESVANRVYFHSHCPLFVYPGFLLMAYGYVLAPLIRFALSRTRESLADAQAALTTRHPRALARALWRISQDSRIEALDGCRLIGIMCIERPQGQDRFFDRLSGMGRSHPPVEERIRALNDMDGLFDDTDKR
ncbi:MAG: M48 family metalloprotease [Candidatus Avelusimicrobium sp.]|uniref:M48 family metalloprotease n=1 Tax=Candidatus Avelusimicrobium sp. TaxID=3048833 RepID=UPI003F00A1D9